MRWKDCPRYPGSNLITGIIKRRQSFPATVRKKRCDNGQRDAILLGSGEWKGLIAEKCG